jgi:hypothetical protein
VRAAPLYVVLLHHPVYDKHGEVVATAVTNMDVHDLARIGKTYGVSGVYTATPEKILEHWRTGFGAEYNETRREALALVRTVVDLDAAILEVERRAGERPLLVATSAKVADGRISFADLRARLATDKAPHLLILGTGWGLTKEILERADLILEPIRGITDYNHLPVRAAAAIMLDRLRGPA